MRRSSDRACGAPLTLVLVLVRARRTPLFPADGLLGADALENVAEVVARGCMFWGGGGEGSWHALEGCGEGPFLVGGARTPC
eukprot:6041606-Pleurochrysis_carterae.AAC.2